MRHIQTIISHVRQPDGVVQSNDDHQQGVAERAEAFAAEFGMAEWGRLSGKEEFRQQR